MSRRPFDQAEEFPDSRSAQNYERGAGSPEEDVGKRLIDVYMKTVDTKAISDDYSLDEGLRKEVSRKDCRGQELLEYVIGRLERAKAPYQEFSDELLHYIIRVRHEGGENRFDLDLSRIDKGDGLIRYADGVWSKPDETLYLSYIIPEDDGSYMYRQIGGQAMGCHFRIKGGVQSVGTYGKDSTFVMGDLPLMAPLELGKKAKGCSFYLEDVVEFRKESPKQIVLGNGLVEHHMTIRDEFFAEKNILYIPDESGGWQEIRPKDS